MKHLLQTLASIKKHFAEDGYVVDPHTAVGLTAAERMAAHKYGFLPFPSHLIVLNFEQPGNDNANHPIYSAPRKVFRGRLAGAEGLAGV